MNKLIWNCRREEMETRKISMGILLCFFRRQHKDISTPQFALGPTQVQMTHTYARTSLNLCLPLPSNSMFPGTSHNACLLPDPVHQAEVMEDEGERKRKQQKAIWGWKLKKIAREQGISPVFISFLFFSFHRSIQARHLADVVLG
jgi:hypothetical protein